MSSHFKQLGATNHSNHVREENDYYATEPLATELLLKVESFSGNIIEPAVGGGHIASVLKKHNYNVLCYDIVDRKYNNTIVKDFLQNQEVFFNADIITNPPYVIAEEFVRKAITSIEKNHKVAMFLRLLFLESKKRKKLFEEYPPKTVYVASGRLNCAKNADFVQYPSSAMAYAWFVWEKGYKGKTTLKWIN